MVKKPLLIGNKKLERKNSLFFVYFFKLIVYNKIVKKKNLNKKIKEWGR